MQVQQELRRFTSDAEYFESHREQLRKQYPDQWVAVYDHQVVGASKDIKRLVRQLERKGIPRGRAFVEYTTEREDLLIL